MTQNMQLRPGETALFQGDVTWLKSKLNVVQTDAVVTDQRLWIAAAGRPIEKVDIAAATEGKHGLAQKMVYLLTDGTSLSLIAANQAGLKAASAVLTGQASADSMPTAPDIAQVKNWTAWLAAVGPLIADAVVIALMLMLWDDPDNIRTMQVVQLQFARVAVVYLFLKIDHLKLQQQGYNVNDLGLADPATFPLYLFSRAKVFKHGKGPAILWCVIVVVDILFAVLG